MKPFKSIFFTVLLFVYLMKMLCYLLHLPYTVPSYSKNGKAFQTKEFRIELKNRNISYFYFGNGKNQCENNSEILIATQSTPTTHNLRMGIRKSWQKDINLRSNFTHKFFIGWTWNNALRQSLQEESEIFGDIVFTNIVDDYSNLTLKMNSIFQWQQFYCPSAKFLLRSDEDTVVDISRFEFWFNSFFKNFSENVGNKIIFGHVIENSPAIRNPKDKWYVPYSTWKNHYYPMYMSGASYLMTTKAVKLILKQAKNHDFLAIDDAFYTGIVAEAAGIIRMDSNNHFFKGNPLNQWDRKCLQPVAIPLVFSISDEHGEIEITSWGYNKALKTLKNLNCSFLNWEICFIFVFLCFFFFCLHWTLLKSK